MNNLYSIQNRSDCERLIEILRQKRPPYKVLIEEMKGHRTIDQNAYYFGVVCKMIGDDIGCTVDEVHDYMAGRFLIDYWMDKQGVMRFERRSTTQSSPNDFWEYIQMVCEFAQRELNIDIPDPNEVPTNESKLNKKRP